MRFSANLGFLWADRPLLARIEAAARAGFRAIEMHWPYDVPASEVAAVARRAGVTLLGINTAPGNSAAGERGLDAIRGREQDFQSTVDQSIEYCCASGATAIHAMAGNVAASDRERARAVFAANLRTAAAKAARHQLTLLLEPLNPNDNPGYFYSTCITSPAARAMSSSSWKSTDRTSGNVQIASVPARAEPDEGEIAYPAIFAALGKSQYKGWVGCEYRPRGDTDQGLTWLRAMTRAGEVIPLRGELR